MKRNKLTPELSVTNIEKSKWFYIEVLGFKLKYERIDDKFAYLSMGEISIMLEEINDHWSTGLLEYPFGRGINFEMDVQDVQPIIERLNNHNISLFKEPTIQKYKSNNKLYIQKEFLVQDFDGYLLRFSQTI